MEIFLNDKKHIMKVLFEDNLQHPVLSSPTFRLLESRKPLPYL